MATFAVSASDDTVKSLSEIMDNLAHDGEKKADTLRRIFDIAMQNADDETIRQGGVDAAALDASLANIRSMFVSAVSGREQIVKSYDQKIARLKEEKLAAETDFRARIAAEREASTSARENAEAAEKAMKQAISDANAARESAEANAALAKEKDHTILTLTEKLTAAETKAAKCDSLQKEKADAEAQAEILRAQMHADQGKYERALKEEKQAAQTAIKDLRAKMDRAVSDAQKDAALAREKAVQEAIAATQNKMQAEMQELRKQLMTGLRDADKENGRLLAKIELQQEEIKRLRELKTAK